MFSVGFVVVVVTVGRLLALLCESVLRLWAQLCVWAFCAVRVAEGLLFLVVSTPCVLLGYLRTSYDRAVGTDWLVSREMGNGG